MRGCCGGRHISAPVGVMLGILRVVELEQVVAVESGRCTGGRSWAAGWPGRRRWPAAPGWVGAGGRRAGRGRRLGGRAGLRGAGRGGRGDALGEGGQGGEGAQSCQGRAEGAGVGFRLSQVSSSCGHVSCVSCVLSLRSEKMSEAHHLVCARTSLHRVLPERDDAGESMLLGAWLSSPGAGGSRPANAGVRGSPHSPISLAVMMARAMSCGGFCRVWLCDWMRWNASRSVRL